MDDDAFVIDRDPLPVAASPLPAAFSARTVNGEGPAGADVPVVMVRVEVLDTSPAAKATELGEKDAEAPAGNPDETDRFALNVDPVAPLRVTVTVYVAFDDVPNAGLPIWLPTVTLPTRLTIVSDRLLETCV